MTARALGVGVGAALLSLAVLVGIARVASPVAPVALSASAAPSSPAALPLSAPAAAPAESGPAAPPTRVVVPALGIDSALIPLGTGPAGELDPPRSADVAGWFAGGAVPGQPGPAVLAGHVDSRDGPGVFYRLAELRPGERIDVQSADGTTSFRVTSTEAIPKAEFPTDRVYGPTPVPELRLVTCGGVFDRQTGHYRSNVIVHAEIFPN